MEPDSDDWLDKYEFSWLTDANFQTPNSSEYQSCSNADSTSKKHSPRSNVSKLSSRSQSPVYSLSPDAVTPRNAIESETPQDGNCDRSSPEVLHQPIAARIKDLGKTDSHNELNGIMDKLVNLPSGQLLEETLFDERRETGIDVTNNVVMPNIAKPTCSAKIILNYDEKDSQATFHCESSTKIDTDSLMKMGTNRLESGLSSKTEDPRCEESGIDTTTYVDLAFAKNVPNVIMSPRSKIRKQFYVNKDIGNSTDTDFKSIKTGTSQFASALSMQGTPSNSDVPEITSGDLVELYLKYGMSKSQTSILTEKSNKTSQEDLVAYPAISSSLDCSSTPDEKYPGIITKRYGVVDVNSDALSLVPGLGRNHETQMWRNAGDITVNPGDMLLQDNTEYPSSRNRYYNKEFVSHSNSTEYFTTKSKSPIDSSSSSTDGISHLNRKNVHNHETDSKPVKEYCETRNTNLRKQPQSVCIYNARVPYNLIENESGYSSFLSLSSNETSIQKTQFDPPPKDSRACTTTTKSSENNGSQTEQEKRRVDTSKNSNTEQTNVANIKQSTSPMTANVPKIVDISEHTIKSQHMTQEVDKQSDKTLVGFLSAETVTTPGLTHTVPGDRHSYVKTLGDDIQVNLDQLAIFSKQKPDSANVWTVCDPTTTIDERIEERFRTISKKRITDIFPFNQGGADSEEEFEEQTKQIFNQNTETAKDNAKKSIINIYPSNEDAQYADIENLQPHNPPYLDDEVNTDHQDNDKVNQDQQTLNMHHEYPTAAENYQHTESFSVKKPISDIYPFKQGEHDDDPHTEGMQQTYSEEVGNSQTGKFDYPQRDLEVSDSPYHKEINETGSQASYQDQATCLGTTSEKHITNAHPHTQYNDNKDDDAGWLENDISSDTNQQMDQDDISSRKSTDVDFMSCSNDTDTLEMKDAINLNTVQQLEAVNVSDSTHVKQPVYHEERNEDNIVQENYFDTNETPIFSTNSKKHVADISPINQDGCTDDRGLGLDQTSDKLQQTYQDEQVRMSNSSNIHSVPVDNQIKTPDVTNMENSKSISEQQQKSNTMQAGSSTATRKETHNINKPNAKARNSNKAFSSEDSDLDVFDSHYGGFYMTHIKWKSSMNSAKVIKSKKRLRRVARNLLALAENANASDVEIVLFKKRKQKNHQRKSMKIKIAKCGFVESSKSNSEVNTADNNLNQVSDRECSSVITDPEGECDSKTFSIQKADQINSRESMPVTKSTCSSASKAVSQEIRNKPSEINWHNDAEASKLPEKESRHLKLSTSSSNDYVNKYAEKESKITITTSVADANNISAIYKKFIDGSMSRTSPSQIVHNTTPAVGFTRRTTQSTHTNIADTKHQKDCVSRNKSHNIIAYQVSGVKTPSQVPKPTFISEVNGFYNAMNYPSYTDSMRSKSNGMLTRRIEPCKQLSNPTETGYRDPPVTRNERSTELSSTSSEETNRPRYGTNNGSRRVIPRTYELKEQAVDKKGLQSNTDNTVKGSDNDNIINDGCMSVKQFQVRQPIVRYNGDWYQSKRPRDGETKMKRENCMPNISKDSAGSVASRVLPTSKTDGLKESTVDGNIPSSVQTLTLPNTKKTVKDLKDNSRPDYKAVHVQNNAIYGGYISGKESSSSGNKVKHTVVKMRPVSVSDTCNPSGYMVDRGSQVMQKKTSVERDSLHFLRSSTANVNDKYQPVLVRSDKDSNGRITPTVVNKSMVPKSMQAVKGSSKSCSEDIHDRAATNNANYGVYMANKQSQANQPQRHVNFIHSTPRTDKQELCRSKDKSVSGSYHGGLSQSSLKQDFSKPGCTGRANNTYEFPVERRLNADPVSSKALVKALNEVVRHETLVKQQNSKRVRFHVSKKGNRVRIAETTAMDSNGLDFEFDYFTSKIKSKTGKSKSTEDVVGDVNKFFSENYIPSLEEVTHKAGLSHTDVHQFMHSKRKIRCALCKDEAVKDN